MSQNTKSERNAIYAITEAALCPPLRKISYFYLFLNLASNGRLCIPIRICLLKVKVINVVTVMIDVQFRIR